MHDRVRSCHKCPMCDFDSSQNPHLRRHGMSVHYRLKDHRCDCCGSRFFQVARLSRKLISQIRSKCGAFVILRDDVCVSSDVDTTQNRDSILAKTRRRSLFTGIIGHPA